LLHVRPASDGVQRRDILSAWYRDLLRAEIPRLLSQWESRLGTRVTRVFIQHMKTKWGSCNPVERTIRLNTELAKKPKECLDYLVLHEMVHLLERKHGPQFVALMDRHMPDWREVRALLNRLPARHEAWDY